MTNRKAPAKIAASILIVAVLVAGYWLLRDRGLLDVVLNGEQLQKRLLEFGPWGPLLVIGSMTIAILISPIPSAPVALAAGAAYGHAWGTLYVVVGAEAGALGAFAVARFVGYDVLHRWFGKQLTKGWAGSQNALMWFVFVSRLLPFVSFDLVSYAAGLTVLKFWRFGLATLAGIIPASFLLAHFGGEIATGETQRIVLSVVGLGALTLLPLVVTLAKKYWHH